MRAHQAVPARLVQRLPAVPTERLRSLPIEFATITLHVDVQLARNPIDDLPNKWNETYTNR